MWTNNQGREVRAHAAWGDGVRVETAPHDPDATVITNIGMFAFCRKDAFCRCVRCKPSLVRK